MIMENVVTSLKNLEFIIDSSNIGIVHNEKKIIFSRYSIKKNLSKQLNSIDNAFFILHI